MFILKTNLSKLGIHSKMGNFLFCSKWFFSFYSLFESLDSFQRPIGRKPQKIGQLFSISFLKINFEIKSLRFLKFNQKLKKIEFLLNPLLLSTCICLSLPLFLKLSLSHTYTKIYLSVSLSHTHQIAHSLFHTFLSISHTNTLCLIHTFSFNSLSRSLT